MGKKWTVGLVVCVVAVAAMATPALGQRGNAGAVAQEIQSNQGPTAAQYNDGLSQSAGGDPGAPPAGGGASAGGGGGGEGGLGSLPFTGGDLVALGLIAVALLASGFLLHTLSRPRRN